MAANETYWAAYASSATVCEITLHRTERAALVWIVAVLGIDLPDRLGIAAEADETPEQLIARVASEATEEAIANAIDSYCLMSSDDYCCNEVGEPTS